MLRVLAGGLCALAAVQLGQTPVAEARVSMTQVRDLAASHRVFESRLAGCALDAPAESAARDRAWDDRSHAQRRRAALARRAQAGALASARIGFGRSRARIRADIALCRTRISRSHELPAATSPLAGRLVAAAERRLGAGYSFGATGPRSFDCSGLIWAVYRSVGIDYTRSSTYADWASGIGGDWTRGRDRDALQVGDLVYLRPTPRGPGHAGIYVGDGDIIHASSGAGRVIRSTLESGYYHRNYVGWLRHNRVGGDDSAD